VYEIYDYDDYAVVNEFTEQIRELIIRRCLSHSNNTYSYQADADEEEMDENYSDKVVTMTGKKGWVYVFYVGHVDRIDYMKPFSIL
jgi:hypothetical protein